MRVTTDGKVRRSRSEWRDLVERFKTSGLTLESFCEREGVVQSSLQKWDKRLSLSGTKQIGFVERTPRSNRDTAEWHVELELSNGSKLRLRG